MLNHGKGNSIWRATVSQLSATISQQCRFAYAHWSVAYRDPFDEDPSRHCYAHVRVVGRPSNHVALVSWGDPQRGRHGDQIWIACTSKENSICILTGSNIVKGDPIFSPRRTAQVASNPNSAILASAIHQFPLDTIAD